VQGTDVRWPSASYSAVAAPSEFSEKLLETTVLTGYALQTGNALYLPRSGVWPMRCTTSLRLLVTVCLFAATVPPARAESVKTTIAEILKHPKDYDGKVVTVEGTVADFTIYTRARKGAGTFFKVQDGKDNITVVQYGIHPLKNGETVKVTGVYSEKQKGVAPANHINASVSEGGTVEKKETKKDKRDSKDK
jgi:cytochrome c-type biogenesis protein CcmE